MHLARSLKRTAAAVTGTAMAVVGLAALGSPAAQATTSGSFSCLIPGLITDPENAIPLDFELDTDLPDTALPGPVADKVVNGKVTLGEDLAGLLAGAPLGATKVNATVTGSVTANGAESTYTATQNDIAVVATGFDVAFSAPITPPVTVGATGPTTVTAGAVELKVDLFDANGPLAALPSVTLNCTPPEDLAPVDTMKLANYECTALGVIKVAMDVKSSTDLPGTLTVGTPTEVIYSADVVLGPDLAGLMAAFGVATVDATASGVVKGTDGDHQWTNSKTGLSVPATGAVVELETALTPAVKPTAAGSFKLSAGDMNLTVATYDATGAPHGLGVLELPCTPVPADQVISSSTAKQVATSTTLAVAPAKLVNGATARLTAKVNSGAGAPAGSVKFTWNGGSKTVAVRNGSAVTAAKVKVGSSKVSATFVPTDKARFTGSATTKAVRVAKNTTSVKASVKAKKNKTAKATVKVKALLGKATGKVTIKVTGKNGKKKVNKTFKGKVRSGKAVVKIGKYAKGAKLKVKVSFSGSGVYENSKAKAVSVRVK